MGTMKALVKTKSEPGIWLEEVPIPEIGINDVLIKVYKTAICGTDVHIYNWDEWGTEDYSGAHACWTRVCRQDSRDWK